MVMKNSGSVVKNRDVRAYALSEHRIFTNIYYDKC